jgi:hypothetical protein
MEPAEANLFGPAVRSIGPRFATIRPIDFGRASADRRVASESETCIRRNGERIVRESNQKYQVRSQHSGAARQVRARHPEAEFHPSLPSA